MKRRHLVILGNGAAAVKAAEAIRRGDRQAPLTLVAQELFPAYSRALLSYYVSGKIEEAGLYLRSGRFYDALGIRWLPGRAALSLDPQQQQVSLSDGSRIGYDELLIATGALPLRPALGGGDGQALFTFWSLEDARRLRVARQKARHMVVLGAGLVGLQGLSALFGDGREITLVEMAGQVLPRVLDAPAAGLVEAELRRCGVSLFLRTTIEETFPLASGKRKVRLASGQEMECDLLLVAVGARPNTEFLQGSGLEMDRGILVDSRMRTSIPHIFAAGDVAETRDYLTGQRVVPGLWPVAVEQGEIAGVNMAGGDRESPGSLSMNILEVLGLAVAAIGLTAPDGPIESLTFSDDSRKLYRRLILKEGRVVGAVLVGRVADGGIIKNLILQRREAGTSLATLARGPLSLADLLLPLAAKKTILR